MSTRTYLVTICHTAYAEIHVEADSEEQARDLVWDEWDGLTDQCTANDITDVEEL